MTISTTFLDIYDTCKKLPNMNAETCKQQAMSRAPEAVGAFLTLYDGCLESGQKEWCQRAFAYDVPTPPVIPFLVGLALGWIIKRR
jgi:hypothetical protein